MKKTSLLAIVTVATFLLTLAYQAFPAEAKAVTQINAKACPQKASTANESASIEIANLSCQELSALGSAVNKVLDEEMKLGNIRKIAAVRAQQLSGEAESVGGLFSGPIGFFRKVLASFDLIDVQPPENVVTLSIDSEAAILAIGEVAGQWLKSFGPVGELGAAVVEILSPLAEWGGKELAIKGALGNIGYFRVTKLGVGTVDVIYDKQAKEAYVNIDLEDLKEEWKESYGWQNEHIYMYIPFDQEPPKLKKADARFDYKVVFKDELIEPPSFDSWAEAAISWAMDKAGRREWSNYCLRFVANAFRQRSPEPEGEWDSAWDAVNGDEDFDLVLQDSDNWRSAPRGALIFFGQTDDNKDGHVGIYLGDGRIIHAYGIVKTNTISETESLPKVGHYIGWVYPPEKWRPSPIPVVSHPWPMSGQNAQNTSCSPYNGPERPIVKWVVQFDESGISSSPLVSADGTIYLSRQNTDTTSIIAIEPDGNRRELVQIPGIGRLEAIGSQRTLYAMLWQAGKGVILAFDFQGRELWRSSLPSPPVEWTWLTDVVIGPDGTVYASCLDIAHDATWLTAINSEGSKRWSQLGIRSSPAIAVDGTVYTVMHPGKVCAYDSRGGKKWEYDGQTEWSGYYDRVDYSIAIGPDGTVYVLPSMLSIQDASCGRLIALTPKGTKRWHADIPVAIRSEYVALYGPAMSPDGSLYVLASGTLYKVSPDSTLERFASDNFCPKGPAVDSGGTIYMAVITQIGGHAPNYTPNYKSQVIAFNPDGSEKWRTEPFDFYAIWLSAIAADGTIYARGESQDAGSGVFQPIVAIGESSTAGTPPTATKADLVKSLKDLRDAMLKKIDSDVETTAIAFTDVKDYWRAKRWADFLRPALRIIEDTVAILKAASDWPSVAQEAGKALDSAEANWQVASLIMMVQELKELGGQAQLALDGPAYTAAIQKMLDAADDTYVPPFGDDWERSYQAIIENHLYATPKTGMEGPLRIPRRDTSVGRRITEMARGAFGVRQSIQDTFDDLINEIQRQELLPGFPTEKVVAQLENLKLEIIDSRTVAIDEVRYQTYLWDGQRYIQQEFKTSLGGVGGRYAFFRNVAEHLDKKLEIETSVEIAKAFQAAGNAMLLYSATYKIEGAPEFKIVERAIVAEQLALKAFGKLFYPDTEETYYMLPQEMVLALPVELSNLWMIADDTDQYLRHLLGISEKPALAPSRIAFASARDGNLEIYVMNDDGSSQVRLTERSANDYAPAWSPNGSKIAFVSEHDGQPKLMAMDSDGSNLREISTREEIFFPQLAWSPDGEKITYASEQRVRIVNTRDGSDVVLFEPSSDLSTLYKRVRGIAWSPDGSRIAIAWHEIQPAGRPDYPTKGGIAIVNVTDREFGEWYEVPNSRRLGIYYCPVWSPDGSRLAVSYEAGKWVEDGLSFKDAQIYAMNIDGSTFVILTGELGENLWPNWSPDGAKIAFYSDRDRDYQIYVMNSDGTNVVQLTDTEGGNGYPAWSGMCLGD